MGDERPSRNGCLSHETIAGRRAEHRSIRSAGCMDLREVGRRRHPRSSESGSTTARWSGIKNDPNELLENDPHSARLSSDRVSFSSPVRNEALSIDAG